MGFLRKKKNVFSHDPISYREKLLNDRTPFAVTEAYKTLRTNLLYTTADKGECPVFGVVSAFPKTGKSLIAANLSVTFSMMDKKVLLIEGDMRKPVQHRLFLQKSNCKGLSELLSGQCTPEEALLEIADYPGLTLMRAGHIPPNPQELLTSARCKEILAALRKRFDFIILDLPPVGVVADAMVLSAEVTGYVFVVCSGESQAPAVKEILERMQQMNCNVLGMVLNGYDLKNGEYYKKRKNSRYSYYRRDPSAEE